MTLNEYLPILRECQFFNGLSDNEITSILGCVSGRVIEKKAGEYVFLAGEKTAVMGIVMVGAVLITQDDLWGNRNILSRCEAGDFFGEPYAASPEAVLNINVVADEDSKILLVNVNRLLTSCSSACEQHNRMIRNLAGVLAKKVLVFNEKITHLSKRSTREKLLSYLSSESIRQGKTEFDIPFDRQELADYLCVERAAMSAELSKLKREGVLDTNRRHFVLNEEALLDM